MTITELITPPLDEILPLIGAAPLYGPPVVVVAGPYLLVRQLRGYRAGHAPVPVPAARLVPGGSR